MFWLAVDYVRTVALDIWDGLVVVGRWLRPHGKRVMINGSRPTFSLFGMIAYLVAIFELGQHPHLHWWWIDFIIVGACLLSVAASSWYRRYRTRQPVSIDLTESSTDAEIWNFTVSPQDAAFIKRWLAGHHVYKEGDKNGE